MVGNCSSYLTLALCSLQVIDLILYIFHQRFCSGYVVVQLISLEYFRKIHVQALRVSFSHTFPAVLHYQFICN